MGQRLLLGALKQRKRVPAHWGQLILFLSIYRPISKLSFITKSLEKAMTKQITPVLNKDSVLEKFQSVAHSVL